MTAFTSVDAVADLNLMPSIKRSTAVTIGVSTSVPTGVGCVGVPVGVDGVVPRQLGLDWTTMVASGFDAKVGQTMVLPQPDGSTVVAVGIGNPAELDGAKLRDAAAALARVAGKYVHIADIKNICGEHPGASTAALFLAEFVGNVPWAHLDIAGTMYADADESWRSKGATGFGTRLLVDLALNFTPPASGI